MKRKLIIFILVLALVPVLLLPAQASYQDAQIVDNAALLTAQEITELESKADGLMVQYGMDVVVLTVDSLNGQSAQDLADTFYDGNGYGDDGVLFLLAMEEREWYISTCGDAIYALTDYGIQQLGFVMLPYLSDGDYFGAFEVFLEELPMYFDALESQSPIDGYADYSGDYYHADRDEVVHYKQKSKPSLVISVILGVLAGGITVLVMQGSMKTNRKQRSAQDYMKQDSYHLYTCQDMFLYSNVTKVRRQQNTSSGGGSSVHRSSGGRSHGGGGGRF